MLRNIITPQKCIINKDKTVYTINRSTLKAKNKIIEIKTSFYYIKNDLQSQQKASEYVTSL